MSAPLPRCKSCFSEDLRVSRPIWWDTYGVSVFARPVRCHHCYVRQYLPANRVMQSLVSTFRRIDEGINQLHPDALRSVIDRGRRSSPTRVD